MGTPANTSNQARSLIYIAGYGRSGSTVLDIALSAHREVVGVGELSKAFTALLSKREVPTPLWSSIASEMNGDQSGSTAGVGPGPSVSDADCWLAESARTVAQTEKLLPGTAMLPWSGRARAYRELQRRLLEALYSRTAVPVQIDSSKTAMPTAWRLPLLGSLDRVGGKQLDLYCLILVRRLSDVVWSVRSGHGDSGHRHRFPALRAIVGWSVANTVAVVFGLATCGRHRVRVVRYEQFCSRPAATLHAVHRWVGLEPDVESVEARLANGFVPGEQIYGNRVRRQPSIRIEARGPAPDQGRTTLVAAVVERIVTTVVLRWVRPLDPGEQPETGRIRPQTTIEPEQRRRHRMKVEV